MLRVAGASLLIATGAIHLDLYLTGYRTIPTIGWLFLLQVIAAFALGLAVLATAGQPLTAGRLATGGRPVTAGRWSSPASWRPPGEPASRWPPSAATCCRSGPGCSGSERSAPPQACSPA